MFTFYKRFMYVQESMSRETWYWTTMNYYTSNRTFKYDYKSNTGAMIATEIVLRIGLLVKCFCIYGLISITSALVLRLILKSSGVIILHCMLLEDLF
jgi:hypothetical protein